jgi:hypothetical protein
MERNNLFEALANYDYEAMINLYASHSIDSLKSFSFMHDHRTRTSNNTNSSSTGISPGELEIWCQLLMHVSHLFLVCVYVFDLGI